MLLTLLHLLLVFGRLSLLAVGGGLPTLPEMHRLTVVDAHWVTDAQFRDSYSLGQITPGPGMLMSTVIGYRAAGLPGALVAGIAMFLPNCVLMAIVGSHWQKFANSPWRVALQQGLGPVVIGLMAAGVLALARTAILGPVTIIIATVTTVIILRTRFSPALLALAAGVAGWVLLR